MATKAIIDFGKRHSHLFSGPYLEIGSKIQPGYQQFSPRDIHSLSGEDEYIGVDIEEGPGVDLVVDLSKNGVVDQLGWAERFMTVHCHCVLEHVPDIFAMAENIQRLLKPGGHLFISVPFAWKIHRIPLDMWRFTPQSVDYLFSLVHFDPQFCAASTRTPGEFYDLDWLPELNLGSKLDTWNPLFRFSIKLLRKLKLDEGFFSERALLKECNLMMIGEKRPQNVYTYFPGDSKS